MTAPSRHELLEIAVEAARAAGSVLLEYYEAEPVDLQTKSTATDPVSAADVAAEHAIRAVLTARRPDDAVLGEEGGQEPGPAPAVEHALTRLDRVEHELEPRHVHLSFGHVAPVVVVVVAEVHASGC